MNSVHIDIFHVLCPNGQSARTLSKWTDLMNSIHVDRVHELCPNGQSATSFCLELNSAIASYTLFYYNMSLIMVSMYIAN